MQGYSIYRKRCHHFETELQEKKYLPEEPGSYERINLSVNALLTPKALFSHLTQTSREEKYRISVVRSKCSH